MAEVYCVIPDGCMNDIQDVPLEEYRSFADAETAAQLLANDLGEPVGVWQRVSLVPVYKATQREVDYNDSRLLS